MILGDTSSHDISVNFKIKLEDSIVVFRIKAERGCKEYQEQKALLKFRSLNALRAFRLISLLSFEYKRELFFIEKCDSVNN